MWLFLSLLNPFVFAITHFTDKYLIDKKVRDPWLITVLGSMVAFATSFFIIIFHGFELIAPLQIIFLLLAGFALTYYLIPYYAALSLDDTSNVTPLFQFYAPCTLILSYIFLKEILTKQQLFAFLLLFVGGLVLASEIGSAKRLFRIRKSFGLMILSSLIASFSAIFFKLVSTEVDFWTTLIYVNIGIGLAALSLLFKKRLRKNFVKEVKRISLSVWGLLVIGEVLNLLAELILLFAFALAPVSLVSAIGGIQPLYVLILGICLSLIFPKAIKEDLRKKALLQKGISIAMIIIGVYLLYG